MTFKESSKKREAAKIKISARKTNEDQIPKSNEVRRLLSSIRFKIKEIPKILSDERKSSTINRRRIMRISAKAKVWDDSRLLIFTVGEVLVEFSLRFFVRKPRTHSLI